MYTREILKIAEENASIAKYLKPEVRDEVQVEEEKLRNITENSRDKENYDEVRKIRRKLADIVVNNLEVGYQPVEIINHLQKRTSEKHFAYR